MKKSRTDLQKEHRRAQKKRALARFINLQSMLGNTWAMFYVIVGGRMTGKSYSVTKFLCKQKEKLGENCKNYWMRISESSTKALLTNNADKLIDPDLKRQFNLDLTTKGMTVFNHKKPYIEVFPLCKMGKLKGVGFFDKDYKGWYNIVLDEFQLEQGEMRTSFDILYNFIGMCENIARTTKNHIRIFLLGNTLEEASTILKAFNFLPEKFGRFYLKSKRCVIDNIEPTEEYLKDRKGSIADILGGDKMSNYTNELTRDSKSIYKKRVNHPTAIIKFTNSENSWFTEWDGNVIRRYNGEKIKFIIPMRPYLNEVFNKENRQSVLDRYDAMVLKYDTLITQSYFAGELSLLRANR